MGRATILDFRYDSHRMTRFFIDAHLDIAYTALAGRDFTKPVADPNVGCLSFPDLKEAPVRLALATIFTEIRAPGQPGGYRDSNDVEGAFAAGLAQLEWYERAE